MKRRLQWSFLCLLGGAVALPVWAQSEAAPVAPNIAADPASRAVAPRRSAGRAKPAGPQAYVYPATSSGDNLWDIAGAVVAGSQGAMKLDRNQAMVAIFRANPQAFPEGNLHRIQRGLDLTIPSQADIRREDRARAAALVAQHRSAYADRRLRPVALYALSGGPSAAEVASQAASGSAATRGGAASLDGEAGVVPASAGGDGLSGGWLAALVAVLGLGVLGARAWWRRPMALDPLELDAPLPEAATPDPVLDEVAAAAEDARRAEAVAASLYREDLEAPVAASELPALALGDEVPEPMALSATDPAVAAHLARSLAEAYEELGRMQDAEVWHARGGAD